MNLADRFPKELEGLLRRIGEIGERAGFTVYAVGGFVRDLILGVPNFDLDVVVEGDGRLFARRLAEEMGGEVVSYDRFGTATVRLEGERIERLDVVTARKERYPHPGALPEVEPGTMRDDLFRRDFTINAMAVKLNPSGYGELLDPFDGLGDLKRGLIRVMHDKSFIDDPTRIFRAARFEQRYDFRIEPHTESLIRQAVEINAPLTVSRQRIWHEIYLILSEPIPEKPILRLQELDALRFFRSDLSREGIGLFPRIRKFHGEIKGLVESEIDLPIAYLAALIGGYTPRAVREFCREFGLSKEIEDKLIDSVMLARFEGSLDRPSAIYRSFERKSIESLIFFVALKGDEVKGAVIEYLTRLRHVKPLVKGDDLKRLGLKPGPIFGPLLKRLFDMQLDGQLRDKSELSDLLPKLLDELKP